MRALAAAAILGASMASAQVDVTMMAFSDLDGWAADDHEAALEVFLGTCGDMDGLEWETLCALGADQRGRARTFFELFFRPVMFGAAPALFTGYFEPELDGARVAGGPYRHPLYRVPEDLTVPWYTRAEIDGEGVLEGRDLEIAWIDDPVDVYFLHVQGSGRVNLPDGEVLRVGYGGRNGHPYRSIGQELIRRGAFDAHEVSARRIGEWVRANPEEGAALLAHNPSYIFFRELPALDPASGPLGAMNRPITAMRSVAVDPDYTPLGAPVWIETEGAAPLRRLMVAQDTGGAIQGPQRADVFFGTGDAAGEDAGRVRDPGRMIVLLPIEVALQAASRV